jgi:hypothetical protein
MTEKTSESISVSTNRTVLLAAPSYDGRVNVWHAAALAQTCKIGLSQGINIIPVYMSYDSLVQRARNDLAKLALDAKVDDLFFVDCDQDWNPEDFFRMLSYDVDIVAGPVRKKSDDEQYNIKKTDGKLETNEIGLIEVDAVGTGFMRIRTSALKKIWDSSETYKEAHKREQSRMVFEVKIIDGSLCSEDNVFCRKWISLGGKIYIDPKVNCGHSGEKRWVGNFREWIKRFKSKSFKRGV